MKKVFVIILLIFSVVSLYAERYKSNVIGQKLSLMSENDVSDYYLDVLDNTSVLYEKGIPVSETIILQDETKITKTVRDFKTQEVQTYFYENGLLKKTSFTEGENTVTCVYSYNLNGSLVFVSYYKNNESNPYETSFFLKNTRDNSLAGIKTADKIVLLGENYLSSDDNLYFNVTPDVVINGDIVINEDGNIEINEDGTKVVYSALGLILSKENEDEKTAYFYDENNNLSEVITKKGLATTRTLYTGDFTAVYTYDGDVLLSLTEFEKNSGKKVTLYEDGKAYQQIIYEDDNLKVSQFRNI